MTMLDGNSSARPTAASADLSMSALPPAHENLSSSDYPVLPLNVLDELHQLNCQLGAYQFMVHSTISRICSEGRPSDFESFLLGLDLVFQQIKDGYEGIESNVDMFREMGVVGCCKLPDEAALNATQ